MLPVDITVISHSGFGGKKCKENTSMLINPFVPNAPFLYTLKTSENLKVFLYFQGVEKECIGNEWVNTIEKLNLRRYL